MDGYTFQVGVTYGQRLNIKLLKDDGTFLNGWGFDVKHGQPFNIGFGHVGPGPRFEAGCVVKNREATSN